LHALCDALLGACALGDIGRHFPDNDPSYKDVSSIVLLKKVMSLLKRDKWELANADITLVAEAPKILPFVEDMRKNIASACNTRKENINIKATTTEGLGFTGRGEGMAAYAAVTIKRMR